MVIIKGTFKTPLSQEIQLEYNKLLKAALQVPEHYGSAKSIEGTAGKISVNDIIAYQIGWAKALLGWYQAGIEGKKPQMPGFGFTKWDYAGLAQYFYAHFHYDDGDQQLEHFHQAVQQIISIVEKEYKSGNLDAIGVWQWCTLPSGKQWPLEKWIRVNTVAPYKRANELIRKFLKTL